MRSAAYRPRSQSRAIAPNRRGSAPSIVTYRAERRWLDFRGSSSGPLDTVGDSRSRQHARHSNPLGAPDARAVYPRRRDAAVPVYRVVTKKPQPLFEDRGFSFDVSQFDLIVRLQLDATVLRATLSRIVGGDEVGLAVAVRNQLTPRDTGARQVIHDCVRTPI